jgi:tRNA (cmo5U34)-methyltransferase
MPEYDTLGGWGDKAKVAYFLDNADIIVPRRTEQVAMLIDLLPQARETGEFSVLDLGAGFGAITEQILQRYPRASVTCVDGSAAMFALARERLQKYGEQVKIVLADLADASWRRSVTGAFDAAVSAIAIHHLTNERKQQLYREVFELLGTTGILLNNDVVATPAALKPRFEALNLAAIQEQDRARRGVSRSIEQIQAEMREQLRLAGERHQSHIAPLSEQLQWLRDAGFGSVDCYWRYLDCAIFGGVKG